MNTASESMVRNRVESRTSPHLNSLPATADGCTVVPGPGATALGAYAGSDVSLSEEQLGLLERFHDDIEAGKYVILIYARKG